MWIPICQLAERDRQGFRWLLAMASVELDHRDLCLYVISCAAFSTRGHIASQSWERESRSLSRLNDPNGIAVHPAVDNGCNMNPSCVLWESGTIQLRNRQKSQWRDPVRTRRDFPGHEPFLGGRCGCRGDGPCPSRGILQGKTPWTGKNVSRDF